ncbi:MAG: DUF885 family protein [Pseudomonadota bacterium]
MRLLITTLSALSLLVSGCATLPQADDADTRLKALYEAEYEWRQAEFGYSRNDQGEWTRGDRLPDVTPERFRKRLAYWEQALAALDDIPYDELSREAQINADVFRQITESNASNARFRTYEAPLNSDTFFWMGLHQQYRGFVDVDGYNSYLARIADLPRFFDENISNMRAGLKRGFTPPAITLVGRDASIDQFTVRGEDNPFFEAATLMPRNIPAEERNAIRTRLLELIETAVVPTYSKLRDFMQNEYLPGARTETAARALPDGEAFYRAQIREFTTLDLTPEQIHQTGLEEVARIRKEMLKIIDEVEFDGDLPAFFHFLRTDPQFYAKTPDELMGVSAYVDKRMAAKIHDVLGFLPRQRHTIAPVPDAIAPIYTGGRGGFSRCWMNTYNLRARPLYTLPALTLHECSPGHSLQFAIALEAPGEIPEFRAQNYFSGYGEGWGLYTEWLGGELGIYRTPYEKFGQLTYEMWRACRLVIDTGVHQFGWTRDQALDYLKNNAALSEHEVTTEIDRYISWPGQALAYKLGELLIRDKRQRAIETLGAEFDQRYFHDKILSLRSVPLSVLGDELDNWIAEGGRDPYEDFDID